MIDLSTVKHIYFIGIGGVSNSAIAEILHHNGYMVSGSDIMTSPLTDRLSEKGIKIYKGHSASNINDVDLIVYTAAVSDDNPELIYATEHQIPCLSRAEMLGQLMIGYDTSFAVAGTHGKTTTTSMLTRIFNDQNFDPTALVGGNFADIDSNVRIGNSDIFITEACEYKESFLSFYPQVGIILNIDEDHLDFYRDIDHIVETFGKFTKNIKESGVLVINGDDFNARKVTNNFSGNVVTYGINNECDYTAKNIVYDAMGLPTFDIVFKEKTLLKMHLAIPGQHNIYNALAAFVAAFQVTDNQELIVDRLSTFQNAGRRFERIAKKDGILLVDDYAHHPLAIKVTLEAVRRMADIKRVLVVFQPHTYSRTKELLHEFSGAFHLADEVIITDIYAAREKDPGDIHARDLCNALLDEKVNASYIASFDEIVGVLKSKATSGDIILSMGAGDVYKITHTLKSLI